jgi:hypothetical protein
MDNSQDLAGIVADLDRLIENLEGTDTGIAALCLKMARIDLQMKLHNVTDEEFGALYELMKGIAFPSPGHSRQRNR